MSNPLATPVNSTIYGYDAMGRLDTVNDTVYYGYDEIGNRAWQCIDTTGDFNPSDQTGYEIKTDYTYNAINRLTDLVHQRTTGSPTQLASYHYDSAADGMRENLTESILQSAQTESRDIGYGYDNLNRLVSESADSNGDGYGTDYTYDLVGNRKQRIVNVNEQNLTTDYTYYPGTDRLQKETHTGPVYAFVQNNERYYAYANPSGGIYYQKHGSEQHISQFKALLYGLPSVWNTVLFYTLMILIPVVFFGPVLIRQWFRIRNCIDPLESRDLKLWHRMLCVLLAYIFLVGPECFHMLAQADVEYANLNSASWGQGNRDIHYTYDANGSMTEKITAVKDELNWQTNYIEKVTYEYNLQNRLSRIVTDTDSTVGNNDVSVVDYTYNTFGIKVSKYSFTVAQDLLDTASEQENASGTVTIIYHIDPSNPTGYAQVLEEMTFNKAYPDLLTDSADSLTTYIIGDDVIGQDVDGDVDYLLYDGHGSTRQLAYWTGTGSEIGIMNAYSYDGYGVLLQDETAVSGSPGYTPQQATNLLYSGEMFDTDAQQYYLRARCYNQNNGTFNQVDPYTGNMQDPQSLHKYAYCHNNPVNAIDPTGMFIGGVAGVLAAMSIGQVLHNIYDGTVLSVQSAIELSIHAVQANMSMKNALLIFGISAVLIPLLMFGAVAGIGKIFGATAAKWAARFIDFAQMFVLILTYSNYVDDLPTLDSGQTNGSRSELRNRMLAMDSGSGDLDNARSHHIVPYEFKDHEVIRHLNMDMNHPSNGVFLHKEHHVGGHHDYNYAMRLELDRIKRMPKSQWRTEVIKLRNNAGISLYNGAPLLKRHGSRPAVWRKILRGKR